MQNPCSLVMLLALLYRWYSVAMETLVRGQVMSQAWDRLGVRLGSYPLILSKSYAPFMSPTVEKSPVLPVGNYIWNNKLTCKNTRSKYS